MKRYASFLFFSLVIIQIISAQKFYTEVGSSFPEFEMLDINGKTVTNNTLKGKPSLIIFFGTRCPSCLKELSKLNQRIPDAWYSSFNIYVIGSTDDTDSLVKFNKSKNYKFKYIPDPDQDLFDRIGDHTIPRTFLLNEDGSIKTQTLGFYKTPFENLLKNMKRMI